MARLSRCSQPGRAAAALSEGQVLPLKDVDLTAGKTSVSGDLQTCFRHALHKDGQPGQSCVRDCGLRQRSLSITVLGLMLVEYHTSSVL